MSPALPVRKNGCGKPVRFAGKRPLLPAAGGLHRHAFSLVEMVLALGVVAFVFVALIGILPVGMQSSRQAIDNTIQVEIFQRMVGFAQQTDFSRISELHDAKYYFDDQGNPVAEDHPQRLYIAAFEPPPPGGADSNMAVLLIRVWHTRNSSEPGDPRTLPYYVPDNGY